MSGLYKDIENGKIFGVCAGIAESTGVDVTLLRLLTVIGAFVTGSVVFWAYLIAALVLPNKD